MTYVLCLNAEQNPLFGPAKLREGAVYRVREVAPEGVHLHGLRAPHTLHRAFEPERFVDYRPSTVDRLLCWLREATAARRERVRAS